MSISIADRQRPYSHDAGISVILPGTGAELQLFPCLIRLFDLSEASPKLLGEYSLFLKGPIDQWTVFNDLEQGCLTVSGFTAEGWIRYYVISAADLKGIHLLVDKAPNGALTIAKKGGSTYSIHSKESVNLTDAPSTFSPYQPPNCDRLSLGNNKAQDWTLIKRRMDLQEILPLLHRLGQLIPCFPIMGENEGTLSLLSECRKCFDLNRPEQGEEMWRRFLLGAFHGMLVPQFEDRDHHGLLFADLPLPGCGSPLALLSESARLIREFFVAEEGDKIEILPYLFPSLHCGRLVNISLKGGGKLSLEWTKKTIRRLLYQPGQEGEKLFRFRSDVRSFRLSIDGKKEKGRRLECNRPYYFDKERYYLFDNFQ